MKIKNYISFCHSALEAESISNWISLIPTFKVLQNKLNVKSSGVGRPEVYFNRDNKIKKEIEDYTVFLQETDIKIWNVSINSNIQCFEKIPYERLFEKCQNG